MSLIKSKKNKNSNPLCKEYWMGRHGLSEIDAVSKVREEQKRRADKGKEKSKACKMRPMFKEYWMVKFGLTEAEALLKIKEEQSRRTNKGINRKLGEDKDFYKKKSPASVQYWMLKGHTKTESEKLVSEFNKHASAGRTKKAKENPGWLTNRYTAKFWERKGLSPDEAFQKAQEEKNKDKGRYSEKWFIDRHGEKEGKRKRKEFVASRNRSLPWFIKRYGLEEGTQRYNRWQLNLNAALVKTNTRGWSKVSQKLFWDIFASIKQRGWKVYFATSDNGERNEKANKEFVVRISPARFHRLDFYVEDINKAIEYDCDRWHRAKEDEARQEAIEMQKSGIKILHVKHEDYLRSPATVLARCITFLTEVEKCLS